MIIDCKILCNYSGESEDPILRKSKEDETEQWEDFSFDLTKVNGVRSVTKVVEDEDQPCPDECGVYLGSGEWCYIIDIPFKTMRAQWKAFKNQ